MLQINNSEKVDEVLLVKTIRPSQHLTVVLKSCIFVKYF